MLTFMLYLEETMACLGKKRKEERKKVRFTEEVRAQRRFGRKNSNEIFSLVMIKSGLLCSAKA